MKRVPFILGIASSIASFSFTAETTIDCITTGRKGFKSHFEGHNKHHSFGYSNGRFIVYGNHQITHLDSIQTGLEYAEHRFSFAKPLHIREETFRNGSIKFGATTFRKERWGFDAGMDITTNVEHASQDSTSARATVHGNYIINAKSNFHVGALALFGMHYNRVFPILGIDYIQSEKLSYFLIFPTNASVLYSFNKTISTNITLKPTFTRQRLDNNEKGSLKRGLINYRAASLEWGLNIGFGKNGMFNVHLGETFCSKLHVGTKNDTHRKHYRIKNAPYIGMGASVYF